MTLVSENVSRKIDSLGRVTVPMSLRKRMDINEGDVVDYFTLSWNNRSFICFSPAPKDVDTRYFAAVDVLKELGCDIPEQLAQRVATVNKNVLVDEAE